MDGTNLKTTGEVVVDTMHLEDTQGNDNLSVLAHTETPSDQGNIDTNCEGDSNSAGILCQEVHQVEVITNAIPLEGSSIVATNSDLSSFSAFVIHDLQVLGLVPTKTQQVMDFLSESWANMAHNHEVIDLDENTSQPFQLVVPRKKRNKKKQPVASKGFKVSVSSGSPPWSSFFAFFLFWFFFALTEGFGFVPPLFCTFFLLFNIFRVLQQEIIPLHPIFRLEKNNINLVYNL